MSLDKEKYRCCKRIARQIAFVAAGQTSAADAIDSICDITDGLIDKLSEALDMLKACRHQEGIRPALEADIVRFINGLEEVG